MQRVLCPGGHMLRVEIMTVKYGSNLLLTVSLGSLPIICRHSRVWENSLGVTRSLVRHLKDRSIYLLPHEIWSFIYSKGSLLLRATATVSWMRRRFRIHQYRSPTHTGGRSPKTPIRCVREIMTAFPFLIRFETEARTKKLPADNLLLDYPLAITGIKPTKDPWLFSFIQGWHIPRRAESSLDEQPWPKYATVH